MNKQGVTEVAVARSFCRRMIQPIKDRVHPAYEYWGQSDPTREVNRKVSKEEMAARVSQMYSGKAKVNKCPKAHSLKRPTNPVRSWDLPFGCFLHLSFFRSYECLDRLCARAQASDVVPSASP
jgi:hypothetical protein